MWCPFLAGSYFGPSMFRNRVLKSPPPLAQSCVVPTPCARAAGALTRESGKPRVTRYSAASAPSGSRLYGISSRAPYPISLTGRSTLAYCLYCCWFTVEFLVQCSSLTQRCYWTNLLSSINTINTAIYWRKKWIITRGAS